MPNETSAWEIQTGWPIATTWRLGAVQPDGITITVDALGVIRSVAGGGSGGGIAVPSGQSGGIPYYSASGTIGASTPLAADAIVLGGGPGVAPFSLSGTGIAGQVLTSAGPGGPPVWQSVVGTGSVTSISTANGITGGPITSSGTISLASISAGQLLANATGSTAAPTGVSLTALLDANFGTAQGGIAYRGASAWSFLAPGTSGQFLQTQGAGANLIWATGAGGSGSVTLTGDISGSGTGTIATTLPTINSTIGTYPKVTINAKGQVTAGAALAAGDLPVATTSAFGAVKPDGTTILIASGVISAVGGSGGLPTVNANQFLGGPASGAAATAAGRALVAADLPIATLSAVGGVKPSADFAVAGDGTLTIANSVASVAGAFSGWNAAGTLVAKTMNRTASTTTVTPTADDDGVLILCNNASAQSVVANDIGVGHSYVIQWVGIGKPTVTAGAGVTLVSPNASPTYGPAARYGSLVVTVVATNTVCVEGIMG